MLYDIVFSIENIMSQQNQLTDEQEAYIRKWGCDFTSKRLSKALDIPVPVIVEYIKKMHIVLKPRNERLCFFCKKNKINQRYRCTECMRYKWNEYTKTSVNKNPLKNRLSKCLAAARKRSKEKQQKISLVFEDLLEMWEKQNGLCYYTGLKLEAYAYGVKRQKINSISIDRIDSDKGYTKDNCVLCTFYANVAKADLDKEHMLYIMEQTLIYNGYKVEKPI